MAGTHGHRVVTPNTAILSHRFWEETFGSHGELTAMRRGQDIAHDNIVKHYIRHTKLRTRASIEKKLLKEVDTWLTPEEAIRFGIADKILDVFEIE